MSQMFARLLRIIFGITLILLGLNRSASGQVRVAPFVGGGALISSKSFFEDVLVRGLVTGGIDIPISKRFSATSSVNVGFTDRANMGVQIGVMYRF